MHLVIPKDSMKKLQAYSNFCSYYILKYSLLQIYMVNSLWVFFLQFFSQNFCTFFCSLPAPVAFHHYKCPWCILISKYFLVIFCRMTSATETAGSLGCTWLSFPDLLLQLPSAFIKKSVFFNVARSIVTSKENGFHLMENIECAGC